MQEIGAKRNWLTERDSVLGTEIGSRISQQSSSMRATDQFAGVDAQSLRETSQYRNAGRDRSTFD
jgi:hypothetical protein